MKTLDLDSRANDGEASLTAPAATSNAVVRIDCLVQPFAAVSRAFAVVPTTEKRAEIDSR